jgi:iron(III) transport system permease protein
MLGSIQMPSKWLPRQSSNSVIQYQCLLCLTSGFISNLQQRVASVQWDVSVSHATLLTLGIGLCVGLLTTLLALWLSLATCWFRITGSKIAIALISSFLLIPLYVQATAWSAGFGSNGWLRLSQVDASKHPLMGLASVVWIHTCAATPYCFWILALGLRRTYNPLVDQSMLESGPVFTLRSQLLPKLKPWLIASFLWAFASVHYDMVVTNLFQTPTLCESVYQQVQFGKLRSLPILIAWGISIAVGLSLSLGSIFLRLRNTVRSQMAKDNTANLVLSKYQRNLISLVTWLALLVCFVIPWLNLISRLGVRSSIVDGQGVRTWSLAECSTALWHVQDFADEFSWSLQLSLWATAISLVLASMLLWTTRNRVGHVLAIGLLGCMLATPGPLINLAIGQLLNRHLPDSLSFLSDRTLIGPILALQFRILPVVFGLLWITRQQYLDRQGELLQLESQLHAKSRLYSWVRYSQWGWITTFWIGFCIAFGDLASYLLVQPPGVTTIAMRMFDLLHYGTKNREAGLAVALALLGALSSLLWIRSLHRIR